MKSNISKMLATAGLSLLVAGAASAADINVTGDIATSTTWTKNNVYKLNGQVYVLPGATLTIEAGTIISSNPAQQGSLAITRGARLVAIGTQSEPIIFTSDNVDRRQPEDRHLASGVQRVGQRHDHGFGVHF